jgi:hypothetical protein
VNPFSAYEWLSFLIPGGVFLFAAFYGWKGWPYPEPGAAVLTGILAASFAVGHAVAAVASWLEPVIWLHLPGTRQNPEWGMFGSGGTYDDAERVLVVADLRVRYGDVDFRTGYNLAYTELRQAGNDAALAIVNQQIGFYRNMSMSAAAGTLIVVGYWAVGRDALPVAWALFLGTAAILFAYRYRRFWRRFGDEVIRGFRTLPPR